MTTFVNDSLSIRNSLIYCLWNGPEDPLVIVSGWLDAQVKALALFAEVGTQNLIPPGVTEREINESIYPLPDGCTESTGIALAGCESGISESIP